MAKAFYANGAQVAMLARRAEPLSTALAEVIATPVEYPAGSDYPNGNVATFVCDVAVASQLAETFTRVSERFGTVDIIVNNAGASAAKPFTEVTDADWQADIDLKLFAAIRLARLAWPGMQKKGFGRIINLLNTAAKAPPPKSAPTSVTRAAGMALTKVLAGEGAPHNILVNAMLIGFIKSDQIRRMHRDSAGDLSLDDYIANAGKRLPMKRMGEADEVANLALFLASDAASYITGCAINMDGGLAKVV
jgi:NAD(P)-dependent dehydrogenase (short-subunit alcohol dehydrogenase family)